MLLFALRDVKLMRRYVGAVRYQHPKLLIVSVTNYELRLFPHLHGVEQ